MVRLLLTLLIFFQFYTQAQPPDSTVSHSLFLIGDAGEPYVVNTTIGKVFKEKISNAGEHATVLFLGDNIYPRGLPATDTKEYKEAELSLKTQTDFLVGLKAKGIFIPGNHDWHQWGKKGLQYLENQQRWLDSLKNERITMLPKNGCPGPVQVPLSNNTLLVIIDTQWFLHQWDKTVDEEICGPVTTGEVLTMVADIFESNPGKRIILAGHHPLITYGEHGGVFTWKAHIFPLVEMTKYLYIPLPVIGSIYPLYRKWFGHLQDTPHPLYKEFSKGLQSIMKQYPGTLYVAGHEHALQYIVKDSTYYIVSGAGAKTEYVREKRYSEFGQDVKGFVQVLIYDSGALSFRFYQVDETYPEGKEIFTTQVPAVPPLVIPPPEDIPDFSNQTVRVKASDQYRAGNLRRTFLGENYRKAWATEIDVPVFDLGKENGGMKIVEKGGGQQTLSLRLADSTGREYVLRSIEKYPEAATPEMLRKTFAQDLVQDQISSAHPYAALVVAPLAEAAGLYHTNPRLVYIPDDPRFEQYRRSFSNTLALFEERPDGDWSDADFFGNSRKIVSTSKVLEKLGDDNDHQADEAFVLRNRLFDLIIGDWDRHDDQWRWATIKSKDGDTFRPIPRDRDQAFFLNEGILPSIWGRKWALPKLEGFDEDIDWPSGLSFNARYFDRSFLTSLSREEWIAVARDLQSDLTDREIEHAIRQWPKEIFDLHGEMIIQKLKARRDKLVDYAQSHYEFLSREVDIVGSDKTERFTIERLSNGNVHIVSHKITKKGQVGKKIYDRMFRAGETKEVRVYGLNGSDSFNVSGSAKKSVLVRIIGGEGSDVLFDNAHVSGLRKKTFFYDQNGDAIFQSSGEVRNLMSDDPSVNDYDRTSFEYNRLAPLVYGNFNPDDGLFVGGGFLYQTEGFRKDPFKARHLFLASVAPLTASFEFGYNGKFTEALGKWNLELDGDLKSPNYVNNFFGMGNETIFNDDIDDEPGIGVDEPIQYYRYRFEELVLQASVSRAIGNWGNIKAGPLFQRIEMEEPSPGQDRFIEEYANSLNTDLFNEFNTFGGLGWQVDVVRRDNDLIPQRGTVFTLSGRNMLGLNNERHDFSGYESALSVYHAFRQESRVIFAARVGAGINRGKYEFYQAQVLGGKTELRGYRKTRFYGDSKFYANFELRLRLLSFRSYLFPATLGVLGFHDLGRIWYRNELGLDPSTTTGKSDLWHKGYGGGIWFTPFNLTVLSAEIGHSAEGTMGYIRLGFLF